MSLLAGSILVDSTAEALRLARRLAGTVDLVEFRVDGASDLDLERLVRERPLHAIMTARRREEGGRFEGSEEERIGLLARALDLGVEWVDLEWAVWPRWRRSLDGSRVIVSRHDFEGSPGALEAVRFFREVRASGAAMGKLASTPRTLREVAALLEALRRSGEPGIASGMGRFGLLSRVLAARAGSFLVYGAAAETATAPGQPTVEELCRPYRVQSIGSGTRLFGILGHPLGHSLSPRIHNLLFARRGIDAVYVPFDVEDLEEFAEAAEALELSGFSVTIPHKEAIVARLSSLSAEASALGAVNTVVREGSGWRGENVDGAGALDAIDSAAREAGVDPAALLAGATCWILGAGGAARALAAALRDRGARVVVSARRSEQARRLASDLAVEWRPWGAPLEADAPVRLVANATAAGMWPRADETPIEAARLPEGAWVFDLVYNPVTTRLLREATPRSKVIHGYRMFAGQAARQFRLFTGVEPDRDEIERLCLLRLRGGNVVLVGLRGSGKSTVGRLLAERTGRAFVDLDREITVEARLSVAEIFRREGEPAFRERERRALERALARSHRVVAAGGGVVLDERNRRLLHERATCVYLDAPLDVLYARLDKTFEADPGRPSLTGLPLREEIEVLRREREPLYREVARLAVDAGGRSAAEVAEDLFERLARLG